VKVTARHLCLNIRKTALAAGAAAMVFAPVAAGAQEAVAPGNTLNLPNSINMLTENDPNVRRATVVVNGYPITGTDVEQRVALVLDANKVDVSEEEVLRLKQQVLRNLIDETLQIQEAQSQEMAVEDSEIDGTYNRVATQNFGQDPAALDAYLLSIGSSPASLKRQIRGELSWQRLLQRNVQPFVNVSEEEVNELLERLQASKGTYEYRIGEIYLSATAETQEAVSANARQIVDQLRQGGSFVAYARQYSEASTAPVGGDLGWVRLAQLPTELSSVAQGMEPGQLVGPIPIPGGFSILYLIDRRQVLTADPRDALLSLKQISIDFPAGMSEADATARIEQFTQAVGNIRGCGNAEDVAATIGANVVSNDQIPVRQLPEALQSTLLQLQIGEATPPFGAVSEGVRVLMLCGRDDPVSTDGPSFDDVMAQLEEDRVGKRAQRYLRDLRRDAIID